MEKIQVLKFGGSSVADATRISGVMDIVCHALESGRVVLVCSAVSGCTDALLSIASSSCDAERAGKIARLKRRHEAMAGRLFTGAEREGMMRELDGIFRELESAPSDETVTYGEILSTRIIARKCACDGLSTAWLDSRRLVVCEDGAVRTDLTYSNIADAVASTDAELMVVPGFIASDVSGKVTTLGRGGSDYSAALFAAALGADRLEIWTDVPGMMTANPKVVASARTIPEISYASALSLAANGAKVLYSPTVRPAMETGIDINIRNTFDPGNSGTVVAGRFAASDECWLGVTSLDSRDGEHSTVTLVGESVGSRITANGRILSALASVGIRLAQPVCGEGDVFSFSVRTLIVKDAVAAVHREFFEGSATQSVDLFRDMLSIDSTSGRERAMAEWLAVHLKAERIDSFEVGDGTLNLLLSWGVPKIVYCTHMDTVPPYIAPIFSEEEVRGRGSCDAKGQLYAMYCACSRLAAQGRSDFGLLIVSGEETGSFGAKAFAKTGFRAPYLVVGEPTDNCLVSASKGTKSFDVELRGKAFHSGYPEDGRSAVQMFVEFMDELAAADFPVDPELGETTWNVGLLRSDNPQNILSPQLNFRLYFRTTFASDEAVCRWMEGRSGENVRVSARGGDVPARYFTLDGFRSKSVAFGSDAPHLDNFEHKMICGPGSVKVAHRDEEFISFKDIREAIDIYIRIYEALA